MFGARPLERLPDEELRAGLSSRLGPIVYGLGQHYSAQADDGSLSEERRRAALLVSAAEARLQEEDAGEAAEALKAAEQALELFRKEGDAAGIADSLRLVVSAQRALGKLDEAATAAKLELEAFRNAGDKRGQAAMLLSLADVYIAQGQLVEASQSASDARGLFDKVGDSKMEAASSLALARAHLAMELPQECLSASNAAVASFQKAGDALGRAYALRSLAVGHLAAAGFSQALRASSSALALFRELGNKRAEAFEQELVAHIHLQRRRPNDALTAAKEASSLFRGLGPSASASAAFGERLAAHAAVSAHLARGESTWALSLAKKMLATFQDKGDKRAEAAILGDTLLQVHLAQGSLSAAAETASDALALCREHVRDERLEAKLLDNITSVHIMQEEHDQARAVAAEAVELYGKLGDLRGQASVHFRLSGLHHQRGEHAEALRWAQSSRDHFKRAGCRASEIAAQLAEGHAREALGDREEAAKLAGEAIAAAQDLGDKKAEACGWLSAASLRLSSPEPAGGAEGGGGLGAAQSSARKAEAVLREVGAGVADGLLADTLHMLAVIHLHMQQPELAAPAAHEAHVLFLRIADKLGEAEILRLLACIDLDILLAETRAFDGGAKQKQAIAKRQATALRNAEKAVDIARSSRSCTTLVLGVALHSLAQVRSACGLGEEGLEAAMEAAMIFNMAGERYREALALVAAADAGVVAGGAGRQAAATERARAAEAIFHELGDYPGEALARGVLEGFGVASQRALTAAPVETLAASSAPEASPVQAMPMSEASRIAKEVVLQAIGTEEDVDLDSPLMDVGLDSLASVAFREALISASGITFSTSLVFDYPSLQAIAQHMVELSTEVPRKR